MKIRNKWIFKIVCAFIILLNILFLIWIFKVSDSYYVGLNIGIPIVLAFAAAIAAAWYLFRKTLGEEQARTIIKKTVTLIVAGVFTAANCVIYSVFLPKYTRASASLAVSKNARFSDVYSIPGYDTYGLGGNPFLESGYLLSWNSSDGKVGNVFFNPVTGSYEYCYTDDFTVTTKDFRIPSMNIGFLSNDTVRFHMVFNTSYNEITKGGNLIGFGYGSEEEKAYNAMMSRLTEQEKVILQNMGEQELVQQLTDCAQQYSKHYEEIRSGFMPATSDLKIYFNVHGTDIAIYRNGELNLKK